MELILKSDLYDFLNDEKYAEADVYIAFKRMMDLNQKEMFISRTEADSVSIIFFLMSNDI